MGIWRKAGGAEEGQDVDGVLSYLSDECHDASQYGSIENRSMIK